MRKPASVHIDIADFSMTVMEIPVEKRADWLLSFVKCLSYADRSLNDYGAKLLDDVEGYRESEKDRKNKYKEESAERHGKTRKDTESAERHGKTDFPHKERKKESKKESKTEQTEQDIKKEDSSKPLLSLEHPEQPKTKNSGMTIIEPHNPDRVDESEFEREKRKQIAALMSKYPEIKGEPCQNTESQE